jgi:uncharacterized spore protein YtfJ
MTDIKNEIFLDAVHFPTEGLALLSKVTDAASPRTVFGEPIQQDDTTVITANSINVGLGYGLIGFVLGRSGSEHDTRHEVNGGGGGGGGSLACPVAVISINPDGIKVEPIIDITKICLAFFGMLAAIFAALAGRHAAKRKTNKW